jgi:hypothetical protein
VGRVGIQSTVRKMGKQDGKSVIAIYRTLPFLSKTSKWFKMMPHRHFQTDKNLLRLLRIYLKDPKNLNGFVSQWPIGSPGKR